MEKYAGLIFFTNQTSHPWMSQNHALLHMHLYILPEGRNNDIIVDHIIPMWFRKFPHLLFLPHVHSVWKVTGVSLFCLVYLLLSTLCPGVHKLSDASEKASWGWLQSQSCTASFNCTSSANQWPLKAAFRGPNRWKSEGARSRLYAGWLRISHFNIQRVSPVWAAVWGQA
jgi:hypothetical protein